MPKEDVMSEYERRCRQAVHELRIMRGNGVIDLNRIDEILDPERGFFVGETKGEE